MATGIVKDFLAWKDGADTFWENAINNTNWPNKAEPFTGMLPTKNSLLASLTTDFNNYITDPALESKTKDTLPSLNGFITFKFVLIAGPASPVVPDIPEILANDTRTLYNIRTQILDYETIFDIQENAPLRLRIDSLPSDGQTFVLDDGIAPLTFEFDRVGDGVGPGNISIFIPNIYGFPPDLTSVRDTTRTAINGSTLNAVASAVGFQSMDISNNDSTLAVVLTESISSISQTPAIGEIVTNGNYTSVQSTLQGGVATDLAKLDAFAAAVPAAIQDKSLFINLGQPYVTSNPKPLKKILLEDMFFQEVIDFYGFTIPGL